MDIYAVANYYILCFQASVHKLQYLCIRQSDVIKSRSVKEDKTSAIFVFHRMREYGLGSRSQAICPTVI